MMTSSKNFAYALLLAVALAALVGCGGRGEEQIANAGSLATIENYSRAVDDLIEQPKEGPVQCTLQEYDEGQTRAISDRLYLQADEDVYPGALLQGRSFSQGKFTPITIPRASGVIRLRGLNLAPEAEYSKSLDTISGKTVDQGIQDILSTDVQGTAANVDYSTEQIFSSEQMLFTLGLDGRYGNMSVESSLSIDTTKNSNFVLLKFVQTYYDVIFEHPESSVSVFRDGNKFIDHENQIGENNPPLYVSKVGYGRIVLFSAESEYTSEQLQASMEGAYKGLVASVEVSAGLTFGDVMSKTRIHYFVKGGDAGLALQPIDTASPTDMYNAVKGFLADKNAANYSASSPGVPVVYTLRYLNDREVAHMGFTTAYTKKECNHTPAIQVTMSNLDTDAYLYVNGEQEKYQKGGDSGYVDVTDRLKPGDNSLKIKLGNSNCFASSGDFALYVDGERVWDKSYRHGWLNDCGWQYEVDFRINSATGKFEKLSEW